jgi:DoxX-like family
MRQLTICLQALVVASIFFVWVVRYPNIVEEFRGYGLSESLRDLVGVFKLTFALLLLIGIERPFFAVVGGIGIFLLMGAAILTHLRVKNAVVKMLPSLALLACSAIIAWINYRLPR